MKIRWPFMLRSTYDWSFRLWEQAVARLKEELAVALAAIDDQTDEVRNSHAEIERLMGAHVDTVGEVLGQRDAARDRVRELEQQVAVYSEQIETWKGSRDGLVRHLSRAIDVLSGYAKGD